MKTPLLALVTALLLAATSYGQGNSVSLDSLMTKEDQGKTGVKALSKAEKQALAKWLVDYTKKVGEVVKKAAAATPPAADAKPGEKPKGDGVLEKLDVLDGAKIVADDGTFLGIVSKDRYHLDSISNKVGKFGNGAGKTSIFNEEGTYGGQLGAQSAFNESCVRPPRIVLATGEWTYLSANEQRLPRVDPYVLVAWSRSR